ncbi:response regulator [Paenibacillus sp. DMB20]|uniref:response regulator n=1 Tax=Paenibacillus sp. DMB20 TaxID=1642570 RepID=UPI000B045379|nr:response regulator [Paenibacillus sp. DMB20]
MRKVFFVDDEPLIAQGLVTVMDWQKYDLHVSGSANDGIQALEKLKDEPVDLLITDIMMPRMNGLELIKKVKEMHPRTKFIVLSGYEEFEYVKVGITLGIQNYILKPINIEELEATIKHIRGDWEREELKRFRSEEDFEDPPQQYFAAMGKRRNRKLGIKTKSRTARNPAELCVLPGLRFAAHLQRTSGIPALPLDQPCR